VSGNRLALSLIRFGAGTEAPLVVRVPPVNSVMVAERDASDVAGAADGADADVS
jgi:hypothetical protein